MDITDHVDYPGDDIPHAAKLHARGIAVAVGPAGPSLVRANSLLVDTPDDDELGKLHRFIEKIHGCRVRLNDDTEARESTSRAALEFAPMAYGRGPTRSTASNRGSRWSVQGVIDTGRRLAEEGFSSRPNHVYMCNAVYAGNPGGYSPNVSGSHFNATSAVPADGPLEFVNEIVIRGRQRPAVLILDTGLNTTRKGATAHARHEMLRGDRLILPRPVAQRSNRDRRRRGRGRRRPVDGRGSRGGRPRRRARNVHCRHRAAALSGGRRLCRGRPVQLRRR